MNLFKKSVLIVLILAFGFKTPAFCSDEKKTKPEIDFETLQKQQNLDVQLMQAVRDNDTARVKDLLENGTSANAHDDRSKESFHQSALIAALDWRARKFEGHIIIEGYIPADPPPENIELVKSLLQHGARTDIRNEINATPLMIIAWQGRSKLVQLLLQYDHNINAQSLDGYTALMFAVVSGDLETIKALLSMHADIDKIKEESGYTALSLAEARNDVKNHKEIVALIKSYLK